MKTLLLLSLLLSAQAQARPRPKCWRGFGALAYLPARPDRPSQYKLDSLTRAARLRNSQLATWSK